jgi:hypothetical protein
MKRSLLPLILLLTIACATKAQDVSSDPGAYMNAIGNAETGMNKSYMAYISASAHSSRKRKIEKMREQAIESIQTCQNTINYDMTPFKGDNSLRQSSLNYVSLCYKVFNDDYAHIVNMDDIAERSYDEMQAYLLLQQATNDTLQAAISRMTKAQEKFAAKYNITLTENKTELSDKMEQSNKLNDYRDKVYLIFYKCNWEDNQLTEAVNQKNVTKIEQTRSALGKYATEGLHSLDATLGYDGDNTLTETTKQALNFYQDEAQTQIPKVTDFFLKEENFEKLKTTMESKSADQRTQQDVDTYNKAVNDINASVKNYNETNNALNSGRNEVNKNYDDTEKAFIDTHTPYYK